MIVLVTGGRGYSDPTALWAELDQIHAATPISMIIEGGQRTWPASGKMPIGGADWWANRWAVSRCVQCKTVEANWHDLQTPPVKIKTRPNGRSYNALAGFARNQRMIDLRPDLVVAAPGGRGTADCIERAGAAGIRVNKVHPAQILDVS